MGAMGPWLRTARRPEYAAGISTVAGSLFGFLFATRAPSNIRWIIWPLGAPMFLFGLAFLLVGWWARRRALGSPASAAGTTWAARLENRLLAYLVAAVVTVPSARLQSMAAPAPFGKLLLWNFAVFVILIAIAEFTEWHKRRPHRV
jgi:hypothetical protein